jgi:predicted ATPase
MPDRRRGQPAYNPLMSGSCTCHERHTRRRIVLTGGPGAGKTAVLEMLSHELCAHAVMLREAAGILFTGGFPRRPDSAPRRAAQRAIFHVQLELESIADGENACVVLCDRGLVDGQAYWPGPDDIWTSVGFSRAAALARYDAVIHLRTPDDGNGYGHQNPLRTETSAEANMIDRRILAAWEGHPRRHIIPATTDFLAKAEQAIAIIRGEVPACCRTRMPKLATAANSK